VHTFVVAVLEPLNSFNYNWLLPKLWHFQKVPNNSSLLNPAGFIFLSFVFMLYPPVDSAGSECFAIVRLFIVATFGRRFLQDSYPCPGHAQQNIELAGSKCF